MIQYKIFVLIISGKISGKLPIGIFNQLSDAIFDKENYFSGKYLWPFCKLNKTLKNIEMDKLKVYQLPEFTRNFMDIEADTQHPTKSTYYMDFIETPILFLGI